ncbi:hypothetical protein [Leptospira mtsangambouensis]|uniref:hypothetical protein n=1 Tax=Leptospira mtsangambouensis TaxID=2484912 RepID=UPI001ABFB28A|nr:hypothetical protein [Leptospira mtsangambouensis]
MIPDNRSPQMIRNWPEQHYSNGVAKNNLTNRKFKKVVRILKTLSNEMARNGIGSAISIPSFLIECLVWNTPNERFNYQNYKLLIREVLVFLFNNTIESKTCENWGEVSELKYLFRSSQPWTVETAHKFLNDAWNYVGYQ